MPVDHAIRTPFGCFLIREGEIIGETARAGTVWDGPGFLQVIAREFCAFPLDHATVIDVGANQGFFTHWLVAALKVWRVVALEPEPTVYARLVANLDLNKELTADRVVPLQVAAYGGHYAVQRTGPLDPGNWGATAYVPYKAGEGIEAIHLDDLRWLCGDRVSLIKVDAQGCDLAILRGAERLLKRDHPAVVFEHEEALARPHGYTLAETLVWLTTLGYRTHEWPTHPNNYLAVWRP